jgi:hypothetical protein
MCIILTINVYYTVNPRRLRGQEDHLQPSGGVGYEERGANY